MSDFDIVSMPNQTTTPSDNQHILQIVAELSGQEPHTTELMTFGHSSRTYVVQFESAESLVIRTNTNPSTFASTAKNIETLLSLGLPVPKILTTNFVLDRYPFAYMALEHIPGHDLKFELPDMDKNQMSALAEQIVLFQRLVGTLPNGSGFGYCGIGETARFNNWLDCLKHEISLVVTDDSYCTRCKDRLDEVVRYHSAALASVRPTCFLDDITTKNVIIQNGKLQGLIDFDCVCYGDPLWWLSLAIVCVVSDLNSGEVFYSDELKRNYNLTKYDAALLPLYCTIHGLRFIKDWDSNTSDSWLAKMQSYVDAWLDEAESLTTNSIAASVP